MSSVKFVKTTFPHMSNDVWIREYYFNNIIPLFFFISLSQFLNMICCIIIGESSKQKTVMWIVVVFPKLKQFNKTKRSKPYDKIHTHVYTWFCFVQFCSLWLTKKTPRNYYIFSTFFNLIPYYYVFFCMLLACFIKP